LLNNAVNDAAISTDSVDGSTIELNSNALRLKDSGITTAKIADSSSKTTGVTFAKMQHISTAKILGRISASEGDVEEAFDFKDEDDMSSNSATALASQQSIKAYANGTVSAATNGYVKLPNGLIMQWGEHTDADIAHGEDFSVSFPLTFPTALLQIKGFPNDNAIDVTSNSMTSVQRIISSSTSGFTAEVGNRNGAAMNMTYKWNAIGH
jgi:hypothetical protein